MRHYACVGQISFFLTKWQIFCLMLTIAFLSTGSRPEAGGFIIFRFLLQDNGSTPLAFHYYMR
jgi:hypothetical protein